MVAEGGYFLLFFLPQFPINKCRGKFASEIYHEDYCTEIAVYKVVKKKPTGPILYQSV